MLKRFFPEIYIDTVFEITSEKLKNMNINTVIFDIDNTLAPYFIANADDKIKNLFLELKNNNIKVGVLSNNSEKRVSKFCRDLDVKYISRAFKPGTKKLKKLINLLGSECKDSMIVGDQIFTDVWGGNRSGLHTALVRPISEKDEIITKIKRGMEKIIIDAYLKKEETK